MKKVHFCLLAIFVILLSFYLTSCSDTVSYDENSMSLTEIISQSSSTTKYGFLYSTNSIYMAPTTQQTTQIHHTYFYDNSLNYHPADVITLNGNQISQRTDNDNVTFDGNTNHIWVVTGNQQIPSYSDTIQSLNTFQITTPLAHDTIYKNLGVSINYTTLNGIDSVAVYARFNRGLSSTIDSSNWDSGISYSNGFIVPNNGTIHLPAFFFQTFTSDTYMTIEIVGARYKIKSINDKDFVTACIVSCRTNYYLK